MGRVVHFEILADDPARCAAFYEAVFGWKTATWAGGGYTLVTTGPEGTPGINGGIMGRHFGQAVINTVEVDDLDASLEAVAATGGAPAGGRREIPGVGTVAYCTDTEGNLFCMIQPARPT